MSRLELVIDVYRPGDADGCAAVLAALPGWFGIAASNRAYLDGLRHRPSFVAHEGGGITGFISLEPAFPESCEIHVLAVRPECHRQGVGRALLAHAEGWAVAAGCAMTYMFTLGPSHPDEGYARTRAFWRAQGYLPLFETSALWGPEQPALVSAKALAPASPLANTTLTAH